MSETHTPPQPGAPLAVLGQAPARGMITLRGDLGSVALKNVATGLAGLDMPARRGCAQVGPRGIYWMSPDELLITLPRDGVAAALVSARNTLGDAHALIADVSAARVIFTLQGAHAREVLAKLTPVDLAPGAFGPGEIRRTRLTQIAAAFWMTGPNSFEVICARSVAAYAGDLLADAAAPGGAVGCF